MWSRYSVGRPVPMDRSDRAKGLNVGNLHTTPTMLVKTILASVIYCISDPALVTAIAVTDRFVGLKSVICVSEEALPVFMCVLVERIAR